MARLITIDEAIAHLRLPYSEADSAENEDAIDLVRKIEESSDIVLDYVTHADKATWDDSSVPDLVAAAVKLVLTVLYDDRAADPLTPAVKNILRRHRDPSLA